MSDGKRYLVVNLFLFFVLLVGCSSPTSNNGLDGLDGKEQVSIIPTRAEEKNDVSIQKVTNTPTPVIVEEIQSEYWNNPHLFCFIKREGCIDENDEYVYSVISDGVKDYIKIDEYKGTETIVEIPAMLENIEVGVIGQGAFINNLTIESVVIPKGVWSIEMAAFQQCSMLEEVIIPSSVTDIGFDAFAGTPWLEFMRFKNTFVIVNDILVDAAMAEGDVVIPDGVYSIAGGAFKEAKLSSVKIPKDVVVIGEYAFWNCENLQEIKFGKKLQQIGQSAFGGTAWLEKEKEEKDFVLINEILVDGYKASGSIVIPDKVKIIADGAFYQNESIKNIKIPESVICIGCNAFYGCTELMYVAVSDNLKVISDNAFSECNKLRLVSTGDNQKISDFPTELMYIGNGAFSGCRNIQGINIAGNVKAVGADAFMHCTALESVTLVDGIESIGCRGFYQCSSLVQINLPNTISSLGWCAFKGCSALVAIDIPVSLLEIPMECFMDCHKLENISIPNGVQKLDGMAFANCVSLKKFIVPESIQYLTDNTLYGCIGIEEIIYPQNMGEVFNFIWLMGCNSIKTITVPYGVTIIDRTTFFACENLHTVMLPNTLVEIGEHAFSQCKSLQKIEIPETVLEIRDYAFAESAISELVLPNNLTYLGTNIAYRCENLKVISYPSNIMELWGTTFNRDWLWGNEQAVQQVEIPKGILEIADNTFEGCVNLTSISVPGTVSRIGKEAFIYCHSLMEAEILGPINELPENSFHSCYNLKSVYLPSTIYELGDGVFYRTGLEEIEVPPAVTTIPSYAFSGCSSLKKIILPECIDSIMSYAFAECTNLAVIENSNRVRYIGERAFYECKGLSYISIQGVEEIAKKAFDYCTNLEGVILSRNLKKLDDDAFGYHCDSLKGFQVYEDESYSGTINHYATIVALERAVKNGYK